MSDGARARDTEHVCDREEGGGDLNLTTAAFSDASLGSAMAHGIDGEAHQKKLVRHGRNGTRKSELKKKLKLCIWLGKV